MLSRSLVCLLVFAAFAIVNGKITIFTPTDWDTVEQDALPRRMTEKEREMYPDYLAAAQAAAEKMAQASNSSASLRMVAEFEPMQAVLVRYPLGLPASLIALFSKDVKVYCLCTSSYQSSATSTFQSAGVVMANVTFLNYATDSYWTRDFGPWWTITDGKTGIGGFTYNRPRPNDSKIPKTLSTYFNVPFTSSALVHTGGNMMADGLGVAASTTLVYKENPSMSQTQVNDNMKANWGIQTYQTQADPTGNYIEHIDCWGKFLSTTDVLIDKFATSSSYYQKLEDVANWFAKQKNGAGVTWNVHRVNVKGNEAYSNSLILNKHVYVPISGSSSDDNAALAVYQAAMPGYDIVGVTQASSTPWENTDALHCRTNGIPFFS